MANSVMPPKAGRPKMPDDYGVPEHNETVLAWDYVDERMQASMNYWIITATTSGRPAATPVWGAWLDNKLFFDGSPETRRGRNISQNSHVVVHLESGSEVVILEGEARILAGAPERELAERVAAQYRAKYADQGYSPKADQWDQGGLVVFEPNMAMGWTKFPEDVTRWKVEE